jgi:glycosyltransferase involved in cell wall biosynthesis
MTYRPLTMSRSEAEAARPVIGWGVLPPPVHGQSLMNSVTRSVLESRQPLTWCNPSGSTEVHHLGKVSPMKIVVGLRAVGRFLAEALRCRGRFVGYVSPAREGAALYRDTIVWLVSVLLARRTIVHIHTGEYGFLRSPGPLGRAQRRLLKHSEAWAQTEEWRAEIALLGARRTRVLPNGVRCAEDHGNWSRADDGADPKSLLHVVFVGNIAIGKGIDIFLEVARAVMATEEVRVTIAGATVEPDTDQSVNDFLAEHRGMTIQLGKVDSAQRCELLRSADVLLFPSRFKEAPSLVVCEAMEHGVVPVVSEMGALPELVHGAGYSCSTVDEYTEVLVRLSRDPALRRERSVAAHRRWREDYSLDRYSERLVQAIQDGPDLAECAPRLTGPTG